MRKIRFTSHLTGIILLTVLSCLAAGEVDLTFNGAAYGDRIFNGNVHVVKVQPDGKILVGGQFTEVQGYASSGLARLNADGSVDTTFNSPDFYNFLSIGFSIYAIAIQPDGKILVGGDYRGTNGDEKAGVRRLNADGSIDSSFSVEQMAGDISSGAIVYDLELQSDGKIIVAGEYRFSSGVGPRNVARLNTNGTVDTTFSTAINGTTIKGVVIQPDGKIIAAGFFTNLNIPTTFRFTTTGSLDAAFDSIQTGSGRIEAVELQPDGEIIVGGVYTTLNGFPQGNLSRLNSDGSLDLTFNQNNPGANGAVNDIAIRSDGKILITGAFSAFNGTPMLRVARLNSDGTLDNSFPNNGVITNAAANEIELLPDNRILIGLNSSSLVNSLLRLSADGALDATFNVKVTRIGIVRAVLQQPDGKVLAAGEFRYANGEDRRSLVRFNADGTLDTSFVPYFNNVSPLPVINALAIQPDGKILVGATNGIVLARLNTDGSFDSSFSTLLHPSTDVRSIALQPDGKIIAVGLLGTQSQTVRILRFHPNGVIDNTFVSIQANETILKVGLQPDGKIIVAGNFWVIGGTGRGGIARLNVDGTLDNTFNPPGGANSTVYDFDLQTDGKIVLGGAFTSLNGNSNMIRIGRLNSDGTLDASFVQSLNGAVLAVKVQPDGRVLIGGTFSAVAGGIPRNGVARLNASGTIDETFSPFANKSVYDIQLQSDGKILLGGEFSKIDGISKVRIARLLNAAVPQSTLFDYDGDGKADVSVFRQSENRWYVFRSSDSTVTQTVFAIAGDVPVPADYDGDQKTDIAIYRPSNGAWWYQSSLNGAQINVNWGGEAGDIPRPSDFDGDGKTDFVFFRPTNNFWYRISSNGTVSNIQFGLAGDKPVRGDFDGDGKSDVAIYRPSTGDWWYQSSISGAQLAVRWGISTDVPAPADYDGDGKTDFAVYRPSTGVWYVINSSNGSFLIGPFGISEDKPVPADYDGDGKAELAVFRPSTGIWYQLRTNGGFFAMQFGVSTDTPTPHSFVP